MAGDPGINRFRKADRVKRSGDFSDIIRRGAFAADDVLVVNVRHRQGAPHRGDSDGGDGGAHGGDRRDLPPRLGITIPRKTGPAVVRNRWKRWIREAFRTQRTQLPGGIDIIVRPKRDAVGGFAAVAPSLLSTVRRAEKKLRR